MPDEPPLAESVLENEEVFCGYGDKALSQWDKNMVKQLFQMYDKDKSAHLSLAEFK